MVDLIGNLCLTTFGGWRSSGYRSKVKKPNLPKPNNFGMTLGRIFKVSQYMHINVGNKTMHKNDLFVTSLGVKGQMNES